MAFIYADGAVGQEFNPPRQPFDQDEVDADSWDGPRCEDQFNGLWCTRSLSHIGDHVASNGDPPFFVVGRWTRPPHLGFDHCPICGAMLAANQASERECPHGDGVFWPHVRLSPASSGSKGRVTSSGQTSRPAVCRRCGATSTGGVYCPNGCGKV